MANPVIAVIGGVGFVLGLITDTEGVGGLLTGGTSINFASVPGSIDLYVGDSVKIDYDIEYRFENSLLDPDENIIFELRFYKDGKQLGQPIRHPIYGAIDNTTTSRRFRGQLWFGAKEYDCEDPTKNIHNITIIASIFDIHGHLHSEAFDRTTKFVTSGSRVSSSFTQRAESGGFRVYTESIVGPDVLSIESRAVSLRVHNPYYLEGTAINGGRQHHTVELTSLKTTARVNYRLSPGPHQILRPVRAQGDIVLAIPTNADQSWQVFLSPPGASSAFELDPPDDRHEIFLTGIHNEPHHPNTTSMYTVGVLIGVQGTNSIFTGLNNQQQFQWNARLLEDPNSSVCSQKNFQSICIDPHDHSMYYFDDGAWYAEDQLYASLIRSEEGLNLYVNDKDKESMFISFGELIKRKEIPVEISAAFISPLIFKISLHRNTAVDWALKTFQLLKNYGTEQSYIDPEVNIEDSVTFRWTLKESGGYHFQVADEGGAIVKVLFNLKKSREDRRKNEEK